MVNEHPVPPFLEWWQLASLHWLLIVGGLALLLTLGGLLVLVLERGPGAAFSRLARLLVSGAQDLFLLSPRRVWALSWLAVKESIRRRVIVAFAVFVVVLLFAGWFLDPSSAHPGRLYLDVVLSATSYLVLLLALFLSALSLPNDIRNRTLHTVVTKPVRPSEIVLGRVIGFTIVGTALLGAMCLLSYGFVVRGLSHSHAIDAAEVARLVRQTGLPAKVNLIAWNPGPGIDYQMPQPEAVERFRAALVAEGLPAYVRRPRGRDIFAACGQLKRTVEG